MPVPGPVALGRGVVVRVGDPVPEPWADAPVVDVDEAVAAQPGPVVELLHRHWVGRQPVVVRLGVDPAVFRRPVAEAAAPYTLAPSFDFWHERLHFLIWANTYDARSSEVVWWWGRKACRLGATEDGAADVVLPDGRPAWVDGGPRQPLELPGGEVVVHAESVELGRLSVARWRPPSAELAPDQLAAVAHAGGPSRIVAPAGSGKTRVLSERVRHLLADRGVEPELVTAVTYNKRAGDQLVERLGGLRPQVRTLNALGLALLNRQGRRRLLDERERRGLLGSLVSVPHRAGTDPMSPYLEALTAVRLGLRTPAEVEGERDDVPGLADAFPRYRALLADREVIDFDEQVYGALELLLRDPEARRAARAATRHLLVDEFQDLRPAHLLFIRLLAAPAYDVFGVGDDDQVIYGYDGADPGFLIDFDRWFPGAATHALEVNYRCPPSVIAAAGTLLTYNHRRIPKQVRPAPGRAEHDDELRVLHHHAGEGARRACDLVRQWLDEGVDPDQVAVLTRVGSGLMPVHVALVDAGVPCASELDPGVLERPGVQAALAYLRIGLAPGRIAGGDLTRVLRRPSRGISRPIGDRLGRRRWTLDGLQAFADGLPGRDGEKVAALVDDLHVVVAAVAMDSVGLFLRAVRDDVGLGRAMSTLDESKGAAAGATNLDDLLALEQVAALHDDPSSFEAWLVERVRHPSVADGVVLSTVHRVKGLEWDRVVVAGVDRGTLPHRLAEDDEEERRILHVALTRGRRQVVALCDVDRPSPFLDELSGVAPRRAAPSPSPSGPAGRTTLQRGTQERKARRAGRDGLAAKVGLTVEAPGGYAGDIVEVGALGAVLALPSGGRLTVRYGERVKVDGRSMALQAAGAGGPEGGADGPEADARFEALRSWRLNQARADGVPPYVVASDEHLRGIARQAPGSLEQLARCPGIGPTRLERYGDEILAVLAAQHPAVPTAAGPTTPSS